MFRTVILFNRVNVNMFFLFVCFSDCKYLLCPCVSDTLVWRFSIYTVDLSRESQIVRKMIPIYFAQNRENLAMRKYQLIYRGKVKLCHPLYDFLRGKESKLKFPKNNPYVSETKPRAFGDAKISLYTVTLLSQTTIVSEKSIV